MEVLNVLFSIFEVTLIIGFGIGMVCAFWIAGYSVGYDKASKERHGVSSAKG